MATTEWTSPGSIHRVTTNWRWFTLLAVPPLLALMGWATFEAVNSFRSGETETSVWMTVLVLAMFGGLSLSFVGAIVWAFRARITIDGDTMEVRGAFSRTIFTPERMEGFRNVGGKLYVYLKDRHWGVDVSYFENGWLIRQWLARNGTNIAEELLEEEERNFDDGFGPGTSEADKAARLGRLNRVVRGAEIFVYLSAAVAFVNFLLFENPVAERVAVSVLALTPLFLDLFALSNRGQVQADSFEGSRHPQIMTATLVSGGSLLVLAVLDRGALLDDVFYEFLFVAVLAKGLLWLVIDAHRLEALPDRGRSIAVLTLVSYFLVTAPWAGGALYFGNKLLDLSPPRWQATEVVDMEISRGKTTSYSVTVAAWGDNVDEPVEITVRRAEFESLEVGMPVRVAVKPGAAGVRWVAGIEAAE